MQVLLRCSLYQLPKPAERAVMCFFLFMTVACSALAAAFLVYRVLTYKVYAHSITARVNDAEKQILPTGQKMARFTCSYSYNGKDYEGRIEKYDDEADADEEISILIDSRRPEKILNPRNKVISTIGLELLLLIGALLFFEMFSTAWSYFCHIR